MAAAALVRTAAARGVARLPVGLIVAGDAVEVVVVVVHGDSRSSGSNGSNRSLAKA